MNSRSPFVVGRVLLAQLLTVTSVHGKMDRVSPPTIATEALEVHGIHQASPFIEGWRYAEVVTAVTRDTRRHVWRADRAIAITSHGVVEITMNDEGDLSPLPVRVFRKLDEWRRSRPCVSTVACPFNTGGLLAAG
jgi:hypothetical protein